MSDQDNYDISQVQVPESFIQEILEQTSPLEEDDEHVHIQKVHPQKTEAQVSENGQVVELLTLLFEEFDKLNSRLDKLQESISEMTSAGTGGTTGGATPLKTSRRRRKTHESSNALAELLSRRIGK